MTGSRFRRWAIRAAAVLAGIAVLLVVAGALLLRTDGGRAVLAGLIADAASVPGIQEIKVRRLDGALPGEIVLAGVTVADRDGVWLALESARIEWDPWSLLRRRLAVERLTVDGLAVSRTPVSDASAPESPLPREIALPRLPLGVRLAAFDLDRVTLGAELAGEAVALRASGRFGVDESGDARGHATVTRTDGAALTATLDAVLAASTGTLDIDLAVAEPAGGVVARLAGMPDLPAISLTLKGRGPAAAWQGRLAAEATGFAALNADVALALGDRPTLGLAGSADVEKLLGADLLALLGPTPQFDIRLALAGTDMLAIDRALLTGHAIEASVTGTVDMTTLASALDATVHLTDPAVLDRFATGVAVRAASVTAALKGIPEDLTIAATLGVDGVAAAGIAVERLESRFDGTFSGTGMAGHSRTAMTGLAGSDPAHAALPPRLDAAVDVAVDLAAQTVALSDLKIAGEGVDVAGSGRIDLVGGGLSLDATATLDRLAPIATIAGLDLAGRARATIALTGTGFGERGAGTLSLRLDDLASAELPLAPTLGRAATLTATIAAASADGIEIADFRLDGTNLNASGRLAIGGGWQDIDLTAALADHALAPWRDVAGVALDGRLRGTVAVKGALADPQADVAIDLAGVTVEGVGPLAGRILAGADRLASAPTGSVAAKLTGPGGPVTLDTKFALRQTDRLAFDAVRLTAGETSAHGALTLDLGSGLAAGDLDLAATDLETLGALAGVAMRGAASGHIALGESGGDQTGTLALTVPLLTLPQPGGDDIVVTKIALAASLSGMTPQPAGRATLTVASIEAGGAALTELSLAGAGTPDRLTFDLSGAGTLPAPLTLAVSGAVAAAGAGWAVTLDRLDGSAAGQKISLAAPVTATLAPDRLAVTPFALSLGDGRVTGEASLDAQRVAARFDIAALPLAMLTALADGAPRLGGTLSLQAALDGAPAAPGGTERGLVLDGALPLRLTLRPFAASLPPDGALEGAFDWQGQVSTLWEALPFDTHRLAGVAELSGRAGGTMADPSVTARLAFTEGRYENLELGTVIDALAVTASVDAGRTLTVDLSGTDGGKGTIAGKGSVTLVPLEHFPVGFALDFADASLVRRDEISLSANGALRLAGDATAMTLGGTIETTRIEARLDTGLPPSVVDLGVVDSQAQAAAAAKAERERQASALTLDLDISVPGQAFVRGRGLDSEWRGALRVTGDAAAPAIAGTLSFVRGQFTFAGKRFALDDSTIAFDGSTRIDPLLDIRAAYATADVTAQILISGRSSDPKIALSSTPSLPQDEVLSRVLFGKGAGSLSPLEGLQLASAVAQLSGQGPSGAGILDKVRDSLGVDVLEVGSSSDGNGASLRAGRYINDRTFVGVTQGTTPGSTGVTVEIELLPNILLDSKVDQAGDSKSGVKWKWDY